MPRRGTRKAAKPAERMRDEIIWRTEAALDQTLDLPDIIEWVLSDKYLHRNLYPVQGTMLKIWSLQTEMFTDFDLEMIETWSTSFALTGDYGTQPDLMERIRINKEAGRPWFREWINILGRRGSKGYIGAIAGSYVLAHYVAKGNPQKHYNLDQDKHLAALVFAGKKDAAIKNQWGDLNNVIIGSPWFHRYLPEGVLHKEELHVFAPHDIVRLMDRENAGVITQPDTLASFEVLPKESTLMSSRGPAVFLQMFDEFAFITRETAKVSGEELWGQATPALDTFGKDAFIYEGSSPWSMAGQFYENSRQALAVSDGEDGFAPGDILRPEIVMFQLPSWDTYHGWEKAHTILQRPIEKSIIHPEYGVFFPRQKRALQDYDDQMRRLEAANPEKFAVERRSKWMATLDAYLAADRVDQMFEPWPAEGALNVKMPSQGLMNIDYYAHSDPSKSGKNTSLVICHLVNVGGQLPHVVVDLVKHWEPGEFSDNNFEIDYEYILAEMCSYANLFMPREFTFDQGFSAFLIQGLRKYVSQARLPKSVSVFERTATAASNWRVAETFKTAVGLGLVHIPPVGRSAELLRQECKFLQLVSDRRVDHSTTGAVQTKDIFDACSILVDALLGKHIAAMVGQEMMQVGVSGSLPGGLPPTNLFGQEKPPVSSVAGQMASLHRRPQMTSPTRGGRFIRRR